MGDGHPAWLVVARRELVVRIRTMWFILITLLGPVGMLALVVVPAYFSVKSAKEGVTIQIVDAGDKNLGRKLAMILDVGGDDYLDVSTTPADTPDEELLRRVRDREIDGYMRIPADVLSDGEVVYRGANATNRHIMQLLEKLVETSVQQLRAQNLGLAEEKIAGLFASVSFRPELTTGSATTTSGSASFFLGYVVMFVLYLSIILYAANVMRSVVEEKTSRVVELLVSTMKPSSLMLGKLIGVGGVGLLQLGVWVIMAILIFEYRDLVLGLFGIAAGGGFTLPQLDVGTVAVIMAYFIFGYFFYGALYAAVGAMVNSDQEAQQVQMPIVLLLVMASLCVNIVANDPRGGAAATMTTIPFFSPVLMPMRYLLGGASTGDVLLSLAVLLASIWAAIWLAARIYRVGILMYGKRPSLGELARWVRR